MHVDANVLVPVGCASNRSTSVFVCITVAVWFVNGNNLLSKWLLCGSQRMKRTDHVCVATIKRLIV